MFRGYEKILTNVSIPQAVIALLQLCALQPSSGAASNGDFENRSGPRPDQLLSSLVFGSDALDEMFGTLVWQGFPAIGLPRENLPRFDRFERFSFLLVYALTMHPVNEKDVQPMRTL